MISLVNLAEPVVSLLRADLDCWVGRYAAAITGMSPI